jgi:DNA polymerase III delta prime subunit
MGLKKYRREGILGDGLSAVKIAIMGTGDAKNLDPYLETGDLLSLIRQCSGVTSVTLGKPEPMPIPEPKTNNEKSIDEKILSEVRFHIQSDLSLSKIREEMVSEIVKSLQSYQTSSQKKGKVVCLEGPPGMGKTSLLKEVARRLGRRTFQPNTVVSQYVGKTADTLREVFQYTRAQNAILLWDEIDAIAVSRSHRGTDASEDRLETVRSLIAELDVPGTILLCTTNLAGVIDKALKDRFQEDTHRMPNLTIDDRLHFLRKEAPFLSEVEQNDLAAASTYLSFRDLKNVCDKTAMYPNSDLRPRVLAGWHKAIGSRSSLNREYQWSPFIESALTGGLNKIWRITGDETSPIVTASFKSNQIRIGEIGANGFISFNKTITCDNDINSSYFDRNTGNTLISCDNYLAVHHSKTDELFKASIHSDWVWESICEKGLNPGIFSVTDDGHLTRHDEVDNNLKFISEIKLTSGRSLSILSSGGSRTRIAVAGEGTSLWIIDFNYKRQSFENVVDIEFSGMSDKDYNYRRIATFQTDGAGYLACSFPDSVGVWQGSNTDKIQMKPIGKFRSASEENTCFAVDRTNGKIAVAGANFVRVWNSMGDPAAEPDVLQVPTGDEISAICFTNFGQALVVGTTEGAVFSSTLRPRPVH